jgi:DNA-binding transcriptional LysR family regulator
MRELRDEPFVAASEATGRWRDYWLAVDERDGDPPRIGAVTDHPDDWLNAIANGYGIALAPESTARFYQRPGVVFRPVIGVSPSRAGVVWNPDDDNNPIVQDFVHSCLRFRQQ